MSGRPSPAFAYARQVPRETWVHPVTGGAEPASRTLAVWRFRLVLLLLLVLLGLGVLLAYRSLSGGLNDAPATRQSAPRSLT
jgi:hypothetical protein